MLPSHPAFFPALSRFLARASSVALVAVSVLVLLTVLSRLDVVNVSGAAVVLTDSMEPSIRPGDMVFYANIGYGEGDVVLYCPTPSHCYLHRVVGVLTLETASGTKHVLVTRGDNAGRLDDPVDPGWVRGRVVLVVPREVWAPLAALLIAVSVARVALEPVVGQAVALLFAVSLASLAPVYVTVPRGLQEVVVEPPIAHLASASIDYDDCSIVVRYTRNLTITEATVRVEGLEASQVRVSGKEVVAKVDPRLLGRAFETGAPLVVSVNASLNTVGRLFGEYRVHVGGRDLLVLHLTSLEAGSEAAIVILNPNCFPVTATLSMRVLTAEGWRWVNETRVIDGSSILEVRAPEGVEQAYLYVYWSNQGVPRWAGVPLTR